jgi:hypothetical protein
VNDPKRRASPDGAPTNLLSHYPVGSIAVGQLLQIGEEEKLSESARPLTATLPARFPNGLVEGDQLLLLPLQPQLAQFRKKRLVIGAVKLGRCERTQKSLGPHESLSTPLLKEVHQVQQLFPTSGMRQRIPQDHVPTLRLSKEPFLRDLQGDGEDFQLLGREHFRR